MSRPIIYRLRYFYDDIFSWIYHNLANKDLGKANRVFGFIPFRKFIYRKYQEKRMEEWQ